MRLETAPSFGDIGVAERRYRLQHSADDLDRRRRGGFYHAVDFTEQAIGEVEHLAEIVQQGVASAVAGLLDEQLAIALDRVQRRPQFVAEPSGRTFAFLRAVHELGDQRGKLLAGRPHSLEIGNDVRDFVPVCVLEKDVDKADDRSDGRAEFLPQKGGDRVLEPPAAHDRSPVRPSSASIFCNSRGSSTGFVS